MYCVGYRLNGCMDDQIIIRRDTMKEVCLDGYRKGGDHEIVHLDGPVVLIFN